MEPTPSWEATSLSAIHEYPNIFGTRKYITLFIRAFHWFISWARSVQIIPSYRITLRSILILSFHLHLYLPSGLFPSGIPAKSLYGFFLSRLINNEHNTIVTIFQFNNLFKMCRTGINAFWTKQCSSSCVTTQKRQSCSGYDVHKGKVVPVLN
jgi:hypothetical protein